MIIYYLKLYMATLVAFLTIDMVWLSLMVRRFYGKHLGSMLSPRPIWSVVILFYLLFVCGVLVFVVLPVLQSGSSKRVILLGILYGLITYGTYGLTNLAIIKDWPWIVTVVDICWGIILATTVSYIGFLAGKFLS